jgi:hypothetical protein
VRGSAEGIDPQAFAKIAADAKDSCPVSKALTGTEIALDVDAATSPVTIRSVLHAPARASGSQERGGLADDRTFALGARRREFESRRADRTAGPGH